MRGDLSASRPNERGASHKTNATDNKPSTADANDNNENNMLASASTKKLVLASLFVLIVCFVILVDLEQPTIELPAIISSSAATKSLTQKGDSLNATSMLRLMTANTTITAPIASSTKDVTTSDTTNGGIARLPSKQNPLWKAVTRNITRGSNSAILLPKNESESTENTTDTLIADSSLLWEYRCLQELGKNGTWVRDWDFAKAYGQHPLPRNIPYGPFMKKILNQFAPTPENPVPWETSWRWLDYNSIPSNNDEQLANDERRGGSQCQIDFTINSSAEKMCAIFQANGIRRVLFLGDSLQEGQFGSLINMMGRSPLLVQQKKYRHTLMCPNGAGDNKTLLPVTFEMTRLEGGQAFDDSPSQLLEFPNETMKALRGEPSEPLLVVLNIGAHYHNTSLYQTDVDYIVKTFQMLHRPNNMYFFRTTIPGHMQCQPKKPRNRISLINGTREFPYGSYEEYANATALMDPDPYQWYLFEEYNQYVKDAVDGVFHVLDVFNMTVLRKDGHGGGGDCLHYRPGPTDWWNHLLLTQLALMSPKMTSLQTRLEY